MSAVERWLPHRAPFRFVDELLSLEEGRAAFALNLASDDARLIDGLLQPLFALEALAQSTAAYHGARKGDGVETGMLVEIGRATLKQPARAGEQVRLEIEQLHALGALVRFRGKATASGRLLVEAELTVARGAAP